MASSRAREEADARLADLQRSMDNLTLEVAETIRPLKREDIERQVYNDRDLVDAERESEIAAEPMVSRARYVEALKDAVGSHSQVLDLSVELSRQTEAVVEALGFTGPMGVDGIVQSIAGLRRFLLGMSAALGYPDGEAGVPDEMIEQVERGFVKAFKRGVLINDVRHFLGLAKDAGREAVLGAIQVRAGAPWVSRPGTVAAEPAPLIQGPEGYLVIDAKLDAPPEKPTIKVEPPADPPGRATIRLGVKASEVRVGDRIIPSTPEGTSLDGPGFRVVDISWSELLRNGVDIVVEGSPSVSSFDRNSYMTVDRVLNQTLEQHMDPSGWVSTEDHAIVGANPTCATVHLQGLNWRLSKDGDGYLLEQTEGGGFVLADSDAPRIHPTKGERDLEMRVCEMEAELAKALGLDDDPEASPWDGMISYVKRLREDWSPR